MKHQKRYDADLSTKVRSSSSSSKTQTSSCFLWLSTIARRPGCPRTRTVQPEPFGNLKLLQARLAECIHIRHVIHKNVSGFKADTSFQNIVRHTPLMLGGTLRTVCSHTAPENHTEQLSHGQVERQGLYFGRGNWQRLFFATRFSYLGAHHGCWLVL